MEQLNQDMKEALKNKEKTRLSVIRMLKAALKNEEIKLQRALTEEDILTVLSREMKQRKESLEEFAKAGRDDLVQTQKEEIAVLENYLPEQLSEDELRDLISQTIAEVGAASKADLGKVMGAIMPKVKGKADGSLVNRMVMEYLSK
jgi:hypothetical protein